MLGEYKMRCPYCFQEETKVVDKRDFEDLSKRRRECGICGKRFNTLEKVERNRIKVVKKDGRREEFNYEKLKKGVEIACQKRNVDGEQIEKMIGKIESKISRKGKEIDSGFIGNSVINELKKLDNVAYIRFASVYRDFQDMGDFKKEIKGLK